MNRRLTLLLALLLLAQTAVSCGGSGTADDTTVSDTTADSSATADPEPLGLDPTLKFPDYEFRVFVRSEDEFYSEEETGNVVKDALYKRVRAVEELLGCKIVPRVSQIGGDANTEALAPIQAGEDMYDLVLTHGRSAFSFVSAGVTADWNELPNVDLDRSWWNQDIRSNLEINGKIYTMTGGLTLNNLQRTSAMMFSHPLLRDRGLEFPYQLVRDGKWTLDVFETYIKNFSQDLNNDGKFDIENDLLGYSESGWGGCIARFYTTGTKVIERDNEGYPTIKLYNDKTVDLYERMFTMLDSDYAALDLDSTHMTDAFEEQRLAFRDAALWVIDGTSELEMDFGVLPYPKYDETVDRYYQLVDAGSSLAIIPITVPDLATTGAITEALAYYGHKLLFPAYYDNALLNRYVRDEDSVEMLEIIRQGLTYDLAYFNDVQFGGAFGSIGRALAQDRSLTLTTLYQQNKQAVETLIENSMEEYTD